jgi:hypothetical protein
VVEYVYCSADAMCYKEQIFDLFFKDSPQSHELKLAFLRCCPGDWREPGQFIFVAPRGTSKASAILYLKAHLLPYLVPQMPKPFPRQRWMGATLSCLHLAPLCLIHDIGERAYRIFMETNHGATSARPPTPGQPALLDGDPGTASSNIGDAPDAQAGTDWAKENSKNRLNSWRFFAAMPGATLIVLAIALKCISPALVEWVKLSSDVAETARWTQLIVTEATYDGLLKLRRWPVLERARGVLDRECVDRIVAAHRLKAWDVLHKLVKTVRLRHQGFRVLSRIGASFYQHAIAMHRLPQYRVLLLLIDPEKIAAELVGYCQSFLDPFTASFLAHYKDKLTSMEARIELLVIVLVSKATTVHIENSNAQIRKTLMAFQHFSLGP